MVIQLALFQQPMNVVVRSVNVSEAVEGVHGEARIAQPRIAVVPVSRPADRLRQARSRCGDDGPGASVHHQVQDQE